MVEFFREVNSRKDGTYFKIEYREFCGRSEADEEPAVRRRELTAERAILSKGIEGHIRTLQAAQIQWWLLQPALGALITFGTFESPWDGSAGRAAAVGAVGGLISAATQKLFTTEARKLHFIMDDHVAPFATLVHAMVYTVFGTFGLLGLLHILSP